MNLPSSLLAGSQPYGIHAVAKAVGREKTTIIRWEKLGLIPRSRRDDKGWRFYTKEDMEKIIAFSVTQEKRLSMRQKVEQVQTSVVRDVLPRYRFSKKFLRRALRNDLIRNHILDTFLSLFLKAPSF